MEIQIFWICCIALLQGQAIFKNWVFFYQKSQCVNVLNCRKNGARDLKTKNENVENFVRNRKTGGYVFIFPTEFDLWRHKDQLVNMATYVGIGLIRVIQHVVNFQLSCFPLYFVPRTQFNRKEPHLISNSNITIIC